MDIGFAVRSVPTLHRDIPVTTDLFSTRQIAPSLSVVAFISILIHYCRLAVFRPRAEKPPTGMARTILNDVVRYPSLAVVIPDNPIVNAAQMMIWIARGERLEHSIPILDLEPAGHLRIEQIVFVGHCPPDVIKRCQSGRDITNIRVVM